MGCALIVKAVSEIGKHDTASATAKRQPNALASGMLNMLMKPKNASANIALIT